MTRSTDAPRGEFQTSDDYEETDTTSPQYPNDLRIDMLGTTADTAQVRILYGDAKPDPQLTPWSAATNWKSPDLEVRNARNNVDAAWRDVPWEGHDNQLVAKVRNPGKVDARQVRVDFAWKDFTLGAGTEYPLGTHIQDVPAEGAPIEFRAPDPWVPPVLSPLSFLGIQRQSTAPCS